MMAGPIAATGAAVIPDLEKNNSTSTSNPSLSTSTPSKPSLDTSSAISSLNQASFDPAANFEGDLPTNNNLPTQRDLAAVNDVSVLDKNGKSVPFKSLYTGPNVARRVLIIFVRHFFCGVLSPFPVCSHWQ
jgi:hypothetical protein